MRKEITFIYGDHVEYQCAEPIANEAKKRGYEIKFTTNIFEKCEIGFYCQHINFPKNSKFSCIMLHDLAQQHGYWPIMWKNEFWNDYDMGFLPNKEWKDMWYEASCYDFVRPKNGCYLGGWPKADLFKSDVFIKQNEEIIRKYNIDRTKKTVLYAPSWEYDGRQLEIIEACKNLDVNLVIKQGPWTPEYSEIYKWQHDICEDMAKKSEGIPGVYVLDPKLSIFNAISLCDVLVSEESSTLNEAMMMDKPVIAVTDWLIPDELPNPPRKPDFPYDFAIHTPKAELASVIENVIRDDSYLNRIKEYRVENYPNIGNSAKTIMDAVDYVLFGTGSATSRIDEKALIETPKEYQCCVMARKSLMQKMELKKKVIDKSRLLTHIFHLYKKIRNLKR